jgi:hypothetical protein
MSYLNSTCLHNFQNLENLNFIYLQTMIFKYCFKKILKMRMKSKNIVLKVEYKVNTILYNLNENKYDKMIKDDKIVRMIKSYEKKYNIDISEESK